jgi:putative ABC transport system ATP-binding protein
MNATGGPLLSLRRVRKSYWRGLRETVVLADVSLDVHAGEMVAVWGQRGSGKTTLLEVAAGLQPLDRGTVTFNGRDLLTGRPGLARALNSELGWVQRRGPQSNGMTMVEYVSLPLLGECSPRVAQRRAVGLLEKVGVRDCARERWEDLTDGERTLVSIAHALVREPRLLIADDPTANLDLLQRAEVMTLLRSAAEREGRAVLLTVPDMPEMLNAHQVGSLSEGRLLLSRDEELANVVELPRQERSA